MYSEKFLMMDRGTVRNMQGFIPKNKYEKLVHLVGFILRIQGHFYTLLEKGIVLSSVPLGNRRKI